MLDWMAAAIEEWEVGGWMEWPAAKVPRKKKAGGIDGNV